MPQQPHRLRLAALVLLTAGLLLPSTSASAADPEVVFTGETTQTLEYGQYWTFAARYPTGTNTETSVTVSGAPSGYAPQLYGAVDPTNSMYTVASIFAPYEVAPLSVGSYSISLHVVQTYGGVTTFEGETTPPAQLTVTPAKLGVTVRVVPDPSNAANAIVTATFTGRFVDEFSSSFFPGAPSSPEGQWHVTFVDSAGETALERTIDRQAGDDTMATSFVWSEGEPGEIYTVSAEFVPSGASGANFTASPATDFSYTAADSARPVPTSTAAAQPDASLPEPTAFGLPLWLIVLAGALIIGLAALVTALSIRLSRRPASTTTEVSA